MPKGYSESVSLLEIENNAVGAGLDAPVDTVTFFRGSTAGAAAASVKERLRSVLAKNPWIAGRLIPDGKKIKLVYPSGDAVVPDEILDDIVRVDPPGLKINATMPYEEIVQAVRGSPADLKKMDLKSSDLVTRITFVSDPNDASEFAMIFQMSHVIADGHTYYCILNMISSAGKIWSMNVKRKDESTPLTKEAQGQADYDFMLSAPFAIAAIKGILLGKKAKTVCYYVDEEKMKVAKAEAKKEGVPFVSSNDVLVSTMAKTVGARLFGEAISFRKKVASLEDADAGNYESLLWLDQEVFTCAAKVRKVMLNGAPYRGRGLPLPGFCEAMNAKYGVVTNWAGFAGELAIGGCAAQLHIPIVPLDMIPFENACIFKPSKDKLAVLAFTKRIDPSVYLEGMPLGEPVSKAIFG